MKVYTYTEKELNFTEELSGRFRLNPSTPTTDPFEADVFVCPVCIDPRHGVEDIRQLPYMKRWPEKHAFLDVNDNLKTYPDLPKSMFLRATLTEDMQRINPRSLAIPWPVKDLAHWMERSEIEYDISFHGWSSSGTRTEATLSCQQHLKADIKLHETFYGYYEDSELGKMRRAAFLNSIRKSRLVLAPPSIYKNCFPYRFYEAMSAGRMPVLVGSGQVYPFPDKIDWEKVCITIHEDDASRTGEFLKDFLDRTSDEEIFARGKAARRAWEDWLNSDKWPELHCIQIRSLLGEN